MEIKLYRKVASSNTSRFEANAGISRLLMKGIFDAYVVWPFDKNFFFELVLCVSIRQIIQKNGPINIFKILIYQKKIGGICN